VQQQPPGRETVLQLGVLPVDTKLLAAMRAVLARVNEPLDATARDRIPIAGPGADQRVDPIQQPQVVRGEPTIGPDSLLDQDIATRQRDSRRPRSVLVCVSARRRSGAQRDRDPDYPLQRRTERQRLPTRSARRSRACPGEAAFSRSQASSTDPIRAR
jgi:hypothetical protein